LRRTSARTRIALAALIAALVVPPTAQAARGRTPVLVYGPGMPGEDAESEAREAAASVLRGGRRSAAAFHVSEVPFFGPAPLWVVGDVEVRPCSAAARDTAEILGLVELGKEFTDLLEQEKADKTFHSAWLALECADDFVTQDLLYEVHFYSGLSAFVAGNRAQAEASFAQAIAIDPDRPFDEGYSPEVEEVYRTARATRERGGALKLVIADPVRAMSAVWLDGRSVTGEREMTLSRGDHLLQFRTRFDTFTSMQVQVTRAGRAVLVSREGMVEALLDPDADPAAETVARGALERLARTHDAPVVAGVVLGDSPSLYRFDPASSRLLVDGAKGGAQAAPVGHPRRVALALSGGWLFYPVSGVPAAQASYGALGLQAEVPLVGPLALDLGVWLALRGAGQWDGQRWIFLLPSFRAGVHVSLATGPLRPYLGGAFHMAVRRLDDRWGEAQGAQPAPGAVGVAGIALEPTDHLRIHADLHAGYGGSPILQVSVGVGLRF